MKNTPIPLGYIVDHTSPYGMQKQSGWVVEDAGVKYGRQYLWVAWLNPSTSIIMRTAFWDKTLIRKKQKPSQFFDQIINKSVLDKSIQL